MKQLLIKIIILGVSVIPFMFSSCVPDDDFLKEDPKSQLTIENAYNSSSQVFATILSAYNEYAGFLYDGGWGANESTYRNLGTDVMDGNNQLPHFSNFPSSWSTDAGFVQNVWDRYYRMISFCNLALSQIDNVGWGSEEERERVYSEAFFLRGIAYLELGVIYGGVVLVKEFSEIPLYNYERASSQETFEYAIDNLLVAYEGLPQNVNDGRGRASKSAAALYLSKAFLALGIAADNETYYDGKTCWQNAKAFATEVIENHPLMKERFGARIPTATGSNYGIPNAFPEGNVISDLFVSSNMLLPENTEAIWVMIGPKDYSVYSLNGGNRSTALSYTPALQDMNWSSEFVEEGAGQGPWKAVSEKYGSKTSPAIHGGLGWGMYAPTDYMSYGVWSAEKNNGSEDLRYAEGVTVRTRYLICDENHTLYETYGGWEHITKNDENTCSKFFPIFYKETALDAWDYDPSDPGMFGSICYTYRNKYAARSGEAYLLLAEACMRDGDDGAALEALNTLRARSNAAPFSSIDIDVILDERARELFFEESRWFTLLRMKPEEWKHRIYDYGMYSARGGAKVFPEIRRWGEFSAEIQFNHWPIPQKYIDLNNELEMAQNTGW